VEAIYCNCYPILPNRLAYPEHMPNNASIFYNDFDELCKKLENAILNFTNLETFNNSIKHYDWSEIIEEYDKIFLEIKKP
jgi:hypothetical protein